VKITKFVHSCLLVETPEETVLFDPGVFSWESGAFSTDAVQKLDAIVITHEHPDHFHEPFVQALVQKFPDALFISTQAVVTRLHEMGIKKAACESTDSIRVFSTEPHADLPPLGPTPENIAVHYKDHLTVGGDRHNLEETKEVLALSMTGPWGSARAAADMVLRLKPKVAFPVHDWHWNDQARQIEYDRFEKILGEHNITFIKPVNGESFEV
jgi:L-ascorbate metabolism protein UlaG (beta-lactamase superfamily)